MVLSEYHILRTDTHLILIVALVFVQRIVLVDILHIGIGLVGRVIAFRLLVVVGGVALRHIDALVTFQNASAPLVVIAATEVVVVIVRGVAGPRLTDTIVDIDGVEEIGISGKGTLFVVVQTIQTDVLSGTGSGSGSKGIGLGSLFGNAAPLCLGIGGRAVNGHTALVELLSVAQNILADFSEVDIEVATVFRGFRFGLAIDKRIEQPELDILDIGRLEVVGVELTHHAAPATEGLVQRTFLRDVGREVIGAALGGIVCQVEDGQRIRSSAIGRLVTVGIELVDIHLTNVVVRQLLEVALDMARRKTGGAVGKQRVDGVPCQQRTVDAAGSSCLVVVLSKERRCTGDDPRLRV